MNISEILSQIENTQGTNAKIAILQSNKDVRILKRVFAYGLDSFMQFNIVKIEDVLGHRSNTVLDDSVSWPAFFDIADASSSRKIKGDNARFEFWKLFCQVDADTEKWMRRILEKHFNIGVSLKTVEKVWPGIVRTFQVQLAEKWKPDLLKKLPLKIRVEPKLDGIRLLSIVKDGNVQMFSRSGKVITNFAGTIGRELSTMPNGVYDGEVMDEDFTALMRQVHRKEGANVTKSYLMLFDVVPLEEWENRESYKLLSSRREDLEIVFDGKSFDFLRLIEHKEIDRDAAAIDAYHRDCVARGYEGAMLKNPKMPYCFGRSDAVVKVKSFDDADLKVIGFKEGTGKHIGKLGSILVDFKGVEVQVGSGFDDETREAVWNNKSKYMGMIAEVRYQEVTPDGSLRFPTFVCWRLDK